MSLDSLRITPGRAALLALLFVGLTLTFALGAAVALAVVHVTRGQHPNAALIGEAVGHPAALFVINSLAAGATVAAGVFFHRTRWPVLWQATRQGPAIFGAFLVSVFGAVILVSEADGWINSASDQRAARARRDGGGDRGIC